MTIDPHFTEDTDVVKSELIAAFARVVEWVFAVPNDASMAELERTIWAGLITVGGLLFAAVLGLRCRRRALADIQGRGVRPGRWLFRLDRDYDIKLITTFGRLEFPSFAWRDRSGPTEVTRTPDLSQVAPLRGRCRSSQLLLEWETRVAIDAPYRKAAETLAYFTHGAVRVEDTTLSAHAVRIGRLVDRSWQYRPPAEIAEILRNEAARDRSGRPVLYASTDACALRRFVDETTAAKWKMANGIRLWCTDARTGETIHLGGEYTWGDCTEVEAAFHDLDRLGVLPRSGYFGELQVRIVVVADGQPWILDRVVGWFQEEAIAILDPWHLIQRLGEDAGTMFGKGTEKAKNWTSRATAILLGDRARTSAAPKPRAGRKNKPRSGPRPLPSGACPSDTAPARLLDFLRKTKVVGKLSETQNRLIAFVESNVGRIAYRVLRWRGFAIGSGAMEALHPVAVQCRIKLPGCRWLAETSASIMALRMLRAAGRWDEFWRRPDLVERLRDVFKPPAQETA